MSTNGVTGFWAHPAARLRAEVLYRSIAGNRHYRERGHYGTVHEKQMAGYFGWRHVSSMA